MKYRINLFVILIMALTVPQSVMAYDFYANAPTGQRLYYSICGSEVSVVHPANSDDFPYGGFGKPSGNLTIPDSVTYGGTTYSVTSIGERAFKECTGLTSIIIPNSVTSIGELAFQLCKGITSVTIPNSITLIGVAAFIDCSHLTSVIIPNSITLIDDEMFAGCEQLTSVTIPHSVTSVGRYAFFRTALTSVVLSDSVTSIGDYAFFSCNSLSSVAIPNSITSIGERVFNDCNSLASIIVDSNNPIYDSRNSCNAIIESATNKLIAGCMNTTIPNTVTSIGNYAFCFYNNLTIKSLASTAPILGTNSLCNTTTVYIPCGSMASYWSAWGHSLNYVEFSDSYTLEVSSNDDAMGTTSITTPPNCVNDAVIVATANYGYHFTHWSDGNNSNPRAITLTQDSSVIAMFTKNLFSVIGVANDSIKGLVSGSATVEYLDTVTLTATANYGYHFTYWNDYSTENPRNIAAINDITKTAIFGYNQYNLSVYPVTSTHGTCNGGGNYNYLSECTINANANYGYHFSQWCDGNTDNPRTIILTQDTSFIAQFEKNKYVAYVVASHEERGVVIGSDTVYYLDSVTLTAIANYGYHFDHWNDLNTDNPRQIQITQDLTYTAYFDYNQYNISLNVDTPIHGTCSGNGSYNFRSNCTIIANANYGYHFTQWNDEDTNNPRAIFLIQDTSFTAQFAKNQYTVDAISSHADRGGVTGGCSVDYLDTVILTATANHGYHFDHWSDGSTDNPYTIVVTQDMTMTSYFVPNQYILAVESSDATRGYVSGGGDYDYLNDQIITATANYGYHFTQWNDGDTNPQRIITLTSDTSFIAFFSKNQYTLIVQSNDETQGSVSDGGIFDYLDTATIIASASEHYHFVRWDDGNTNNPREHVIVGDATLTSIFAIDTHAVSVTTNDIARGMVEATSSEFAYGMPCTVTATAYTGYVFSHWSNGITANPYTFAVLEDTELMAFFEEEGTQDIDETMTPQLICHTHLGVLNIAGAMGMEICIIAIDGRIIKQLQCTENSMQIVGLSNGVYLIRIGDNYIQKFVITR